MKTNHYARKKRQLNVLAQKLNELLTEGENRTSIEIEKIILKIRFLVNELSAVFGKHYFKKVLGVAAVSLGMFYANEVNAQTFQAPKSNPFGLVATSYLAIPAFADLDDDGDLDLLVGEEYGMMQYFENTGSSTNPQYKSPTETPFGIFPGYSFGFPTFADLDNDGDLDLLMGEYYGNMKYSENIGTKTAAQFSPPIDSPFGIDSVYLIGAPQFADLDGDGDLDLLVGEYYGAIQYFENIGTANSPAFSAPVKNPFGLVSTEYFAFPAVADLDNDGDLDLLVGEQYGVMQYFENTGSAANPQFASPTTNPFGLTSTYEFAFPAFADLDDDGDMDLLVGEYYGAMQYFKNELITGIENEEFISNFKVFPNPVKENLYVETQEPISQIEIINILGQSVFVESNPGRQLDVKNLSPGFYTVKINYSSGGSTVSKFQKL